MFVVVFTIVGSVLVLVGTPIIIPFVFITTAWILFWLSLITIDIIIVVIIYFEAPELFDKANTKVIDKESAKRAAGIDDGGSH